MKPDGTKIHHRRSIRWTGHDYARGGTYFMTVCVRGHACLFGEIVAGKMRSSELGRIVQATWDNLPNRYPHVELDAFALMPNHVHMVIVLTVGAGFKPALTSPAVGQSAYMRPVQSGTDRAGLKPAPTKRHGLPEIVRAFKTFSARQINARRGMRGEPLWQRNYFEHVIRDERELGLIRTYIADNPMRWEFDREPLRRNVKTGAKEKSGCHEGIGWATRLPIGVRGELVRRKDRLYVAMSQVWRRVG